jgi:hypothetical protein
MYMTTKVVALVVAPRCGPRVAPGSDQIVVDYTGYGIVFSNPTAQHGVDVLHELRVTVPTMSESWVNGVRAQGPPRPRCTRSRAPSTSASDDGHQAIATIGGRSSSTGRSPTTSGRRWSPTSTPWFGVGSPPVVFEAALYAPTFAQDQFVTAPLLDGSGLRAQPGCRARFGHGSASRRWRALPAGDQPDQFLTTPLLDAVASSSRR